MRRGGGPCCRLFNTFVNVEPKLVQTILARPLDLVGVKYRDALRSGHTITPRIMEIFGGMAGQT
eukprot:2724051-Pleurochrysis_carterae.AAC.2